MREDRRKINKANDVGNSMDFSVFSSLQENHSVSPVQHILMIIGCTLMDLIIHEDVK